MYSIYCYRSTLMNKIQSSIMYKKKKIVQNECLLQHYFKFILD